MSSRPSSLARWFAASAAVALPLAVIATWFILHRGYPRGHDAMNATTAQEIFLAFKAKGLGAWFEALFYNRNYKSLIYPVLFAPILGLFSGKMLPSVALFQLGCFATILASTFTLVYRASQRLALAALSTWVIGTIPWLIHNTFTFNAEMTYLTMISLALVFAQDFIIRLQRNKAPSIANTVLLSLFAALAANTRPVEGFLFFVPLAAALGFAYFQRHKPRLSDYLLAASYTALCLITMLVPVLTAADYPRPLSTYIACGLTLITGTYLFFLYRRRQAFPFHLCLTLTLFLVTAWFTPTVRSVIYWALDCSFGLAARETGGRQGVGFLSFLGVMLDKFGRSPLAPTLLLTAASLLVATKGQHAKWQAIKKAFYLKPWFTTPALFLIAAPMFMGAISFNFDDRYYYGPSYFTLVTAFAILLHLSKPWRWSAALISPVLALILSAQLWFVVTESFNIPNTSAFESSIFSAANFRWPAFGILPNLIRNDRTAKLFNEMDQAVQADCGGCRDKRIGILFDDSTDLGLMDYYTLPLLTLEQDRGYTFEVTNLADYEHQRDWVQKAVKTNDYFIIPSLHYPLQKTQKPPAFVLKTIQGLHRDNNEYPYWIAKSLPNEYEATPPDFLRTQPQGLTLWLDASHGPKDRKSGQPLAGSVSIKASNQGKVFFFNENSNTTAVNGLSLKNLMPRGEGTLLLVYKNDATSRAEVLGFGQCLESAFSLTADGTNAFATIGKEGRDSIYISNIAPQNKPHLLTLITGEQAIRADIDGKPRSLRNGISAPQQDLFLPQSLLLGTGPCKTKFTGEIAEMIFFNRALKPLELNSAHDYLIAKYKIKSQKTY